MASGPSISREYQWAFVSSIIEKVIVIQYPKGIDTLHSRELSLLPINPPEVDALVFEWAVQDIEKSFQETAIGNIKVDWVLRRGVVMKCFCHVFVQIFIVLDTVGGVIVQSYFQFSAMELSEKCWGVGKQLLVPCIASPTGIPSLDNPLIINDVPIYKVVKISLGTV